MLRQKVDSIDRESLSPFEIIAKEQRNYPGYAHRFAEDVRLQILPYSQTNSEIVKIESDDKNILNKLAIIFSVSQHYDHSTQNAITEFIRTTAYQLAFSGKVFYEFATINLKKSLGEECNMALHSLLYIPGIVCNFGLFYFQLARNNNYQQILRYLPKGIVFPFYLPNKICSGLNNSVIIKSLNQSGKIYPYEQVHKSNKQIDLNKILDYQTILSLQATNNWGWPINSMLDRKTLEYYFVYRHLKFTRNLAILRKYIVSRINDFFITSNLNCKISIQTKTSDTCIN